VSLQVLSVLEGLAAIWRDNQTVNRRLGKKYLGRFVGYLTTHFNCLGYVGVKGGMIVNDTLERKCVAYLRQCSRIFIETGE
jgi:hypothetical protein